MPVIGFNFNKMSIERKGSPKGRVDIKNDISVKEVEEKDFSLGPSKQNGLRFVFEFESKYEPDFATINFGGEVLFMEKEEKVKEILDKWKKDKKVDQATMHLILNAALSKCNVKALVLSDDLNLPPPVPMPKIEMKK